MAKKSYSPVATYAALKRVSDLLAQAETAVDVSEICKSDGPKVGYKAFCYMLTGKMTAEAMKPDEACEAAASLAEAGESDAAQAIYREVLAAFPDHAEARAGLGA